MLIKMIRDDGKTADVHPDMVEDYKLGNYRVVETLDEKPAKGAYNKRNKDRSED